MTITNIAIVALFVAGMGCMVLFFIVRIVPWLKAVAWWIFHIAATVPATFYWLYRHYRHHNKEV